MGSRFAEWTGVRFGMKQQAVGFADDRNGSNRGNFSGDGAVKPSCALGCEGIVSKRLESPYRAGRVDHWLKIKNPAAPAVRRLEEEGWSR